jgi:hypothetical protein
VTAGRLVLDGERLSGVTRFGRHSTAAVIEIRDGASAFRIGAWRAPAGSVALDAPHTFVSAADFEWLAAQLRPRIPPARVETEKDDAELDEARPPDRARNLRD